MRPHPGRHEEQEQSKGDIDGSPPTPADSMVLEGDWSQLEPDLFCCRIAFGPLLPVVEGGLEPLVL